MGDHPGPIPPNRKPSPSICGQKQIVSNRYSRIGSKPRPSGKPAGHVSVWCDDASHQLVGTNRIRRTLPSLRNASLLLHRLLARYETRVADRSRQDRSPRSARRACASRGDVDGSLQPITVLIRPARRPSSSRSQCPSTVPMSWVTFPTVVPTPLISRNNINNAGRSGHVEVPGGLIALSRSSMDSSPHSCPSTHPTTQITHHPEQSRAPTSAQ